jgi:hypothetical protein
MFPMFINGFRKDKNIINVNNGEVIGADKPNMIINVAERSNLFFLCRVPHVIIVYVAFFFFFFLFRGKFTLPLKVLGAFQF